VTAGLTPNPILKVKVKVVATTMKRIGVTIVAAIITMIMIWMIT
jgi:hypothetical protein